jgi:fatty acid kinase fatty acid binding subunit
MKELAPMIRVRVMTDSTADLDPRLAAEHGVVIIPLSVSFGDDTYLDGVDLDSRAFFEKLAHGQTRPVTSQPSPDAFERAFRDAMTQGATGIVLVDVSSKLSGTYSTALGMAEQLRSSGFAMPIEVIDSRQASLAIQFGVLAAAEAARQGSDVRAVADAACDALARTSIYLVADDLGYLQRGGRIGQAQWLAGTLLSVKPIITLREGAVVPLENPRTRRHAYERLAQLVREMAPVEAVIVGQSSQERGDELEAAIRREYSGPLRRAWAGATIGSHVGPGAVGLAVLRARPS